MLSISELITLAIVAVAVWYGFKWVESYKALRRRRRRAETPTPAQQGTEDMVRCTVCGVYVPGHGALPCPRADCPLRR